MHKGSLRLPAAEPAPGAHESFLLHVFEIPHFIEVTQRQHRALFRRQLRENEMRFIARLPRGERGIFRGGNPRERIAALRRREQTREPSIPHAMTTPTSNPQPKRRRWLAALVLAGVFLAGLAGGAFLVFQKQVCHVLSAPAAGPAPIDRLLAAGEKRLASELRLTEPERASVHDSLTHTAARLKDLRWRTAAELRELVRSAPPSTFSLGIGRPTSRA